MSVFFVYKFRIKKSGLFYVGITNNLDVRKCNHWSAIHIAVKLARTRKPALPGYSKIVLSFLNTIDLDYSYIKSVVLFKVIDIKDSKQEAAALEKALIYKYKNHPKFLNTLI